MRTGFVSYMKARRRKHYAVAIAMNLLCNLLFYFSFHNILHSFFLVGLRGFEVDTFILNYFTDIKSYSSE